MVFIVKRLEYTASRKELLISKTAISVNNPLTTSTQKLIFLHYRS
ncbi:hypothetical protein JCM19301_966 [Jejuia pallidilutea]|uniref:Uncharacterized protein n=1 Tax=Jejuia pallidilutea TaxID=504487 RepID=A0A090VWM7_9FLAO|nr:hypothetical protein JCM19301_966 [Jejuia pallidilutea]